MSHARGLAVTFADRADGERDPPSGPSLSEPAISGLLQMLVEIAVSTIPGLDGASVSLAVAGGRRLQTPSASSQSIREIDESQYVHRQGPCVEAIRTNGEVTWTMPGEEWPEFSRRAQESGVGSVLSLPLRVGERAIGALNLYSMDDTPIHGVEATAARTVASQAAIVLTNASALTSAKLNNRQLAETLAGRDLIGQAKGILMAREGMSADEAFDTLCRISQCADRALRDVAAQIAARAETTRAGAGAPSSTVSWREERIAAPTPHGGAVAIVQRDHASGTCVITEYDARGLVVYRFEYQRDRAATADRSAVVELTVTDWDEQVVERRSVAAFPPDPLGADGLAAFADVPRS